LQDAVAGVHATRAEVAFFQQPDSLDLRSLPHMRALRASIVDNSSLSPFFYFPGAEGAGFTHS